MNIIAMIAHMNLKYYEKSRKLMLQFVAKTAKIPMSIEKYPFLVPTQMENQLPVLHPGAVDVPGEIATLVINL
jgi:hypothetical protein